MDKEFIYYEGDEISSIFFLKQGSCCFVLPKFDNAKYMSIRPGVDFGMEDLVGSIIQNESNIQDDWFSCKDQLIRQFTIICDSDKALLLSLSIGDLHRMQLEFVEMYEQLFL